MASVNWKALIWHVRSTVAGCVHMRFGLRSMRGSALWEAAALLVAPLRSHGTCGTSLLREEEEE